MPSPITNQRISTDVTLTSSLAVTVQMKLSPREYTVESQLIASITGAAFTQTRNCFILFSVFLSG